MQAITKYFLSLIAALAVALLYGCVDAKPIETSTVVDERPVLMFNFESPIPVEPVKIYINKLYMGDAQKYQKGQLGLKVIPGTQIIRLELNGSTILEQKIYLGRGLTKIITVNTN
jgi:hypothetical protein